MGAYTESDDSCFQILVRTVNQTALGCSREFGILRLASFGLLPQCPQAVPEDLHHS
jgi:hypothetical protein